MDIGFWDAVVVVATVVAAVNMAHWYSLYHANSFEMRSNGYNFTVYYDMPENRLAEKHPGIVNETAGFTYGDRRIWLEASAAQNRSEFHDFCDHEVLHNVHPSMRHNLVYELAREIDFEVCSDVAREAAYRGWF